LRRFVGQQAGQQEGSQNGSGRAVKTAAVPAIDGSQNGSQNGSDQSLYDANFALLTDQEKADWLANGMQNGASTRVTRLSEVPAHPMYPSYPGAQDALKRHEQFLKKRAGKQRQEQPQKQERVSVIGSLEIKPTPKAKQPGRKRDVLPPDEYKHAKVSALAAEELAEYEARPLCPKCGFKHEPSNDCIQIRESKRKR
jgi:hypothetical protein